MGLYIAARGSPCLQMVFSSFYFKMSLSPQGINPLTNVNMYVKWKYIIHESVEMLPFWRLRKMEIQIGRSSIHTRVSSQHIGKAAYSDTDWSVYSALWTRLGCYCNFVHGATMTARLLALCPVDPCLGHIWTSKCGCSFWVLSVRALVAFSCHYFWDLASL